MRKFRFLIGMVALCWLHTAAMAAEGSSVAGPIGGTDIRSAHLPPPGVYGGLILFFAKADQFFDGSGNLVEPLRELDLTRKRVAPFLLYVPDVQLFGGSLGLLGTVPVGTECGRLFEATPSQCIAGIGDPYIELVWSRFFGTMRPSHYPGAFPVAEGLALSLGVGVIVPVGEFEVEDAALQGLTIGNNIWDIAPFAALTYTTKPILADGTEISAKAYWNNYISNPDTHYRTGSLISTDFAVSERIGRLQVGIAGLYAVQVEDDELFGTGVPPDGRRAEVLSLGPVLSYDLPEFDASFKIKALTSVRVRNAVQSWGISAGWVKRF